MYCIMETRSLSLCLTYVFFLIFGGVIFMFLEWEVEEKKILIETQEWSRIKDLNSDYAASDNNEVNTLIDWLKERCFNITEDFAKLILKPENIVLLQEDLENRCRGLHFEEVDYTYTYTWTFIDALYFSMTVATTIGYGHISPSTAVGQIVCIFYSLVGIPLTGMLLAWTSGIFGEKLFEIYSKKLDAQRQRSNAFILLGTLIYILLGFVVFIFLPAIVFCYIESWTYLESVYYAYITLTTIGFGDFVSGRNMSPGPWLYVYQILVIAWILVGLGYWVMVANFITRALKSKKMHMLATKAAELKKMMGLGNTDPEFVSQRSKATLNLMLQLSTALADVNFETVEEGSNGTATRAAPLSPPRVIPGISSLFGKGVLGTEPYGIYGQMIAASRPQTPRPEKKIVEKNSSSQENVPSSPMKNSSEQKEESPDRRSSDNLLGEDVSSATGNKVRQQTTPETEHRKTSKNITSNYESLVNSKDRQLLSKDNADDSLAVNIIPLLSTEDTNTSEQPNKQTSSLKYLDEGVSYECDVTGSSKASHNNLDSGISPDVLSIDEVDDLPESYIYDFAESSLKPRQKDQIKLKPTEPHATGLQLTTTESNSFALNVNKFDFSHQNSEEKRKISQSSSQDQDSFSVEDEASSIELERECNHMPNISKQTFIDKSLLRSVTKGQGSLLNTKEHVSPRDKEDKTGNPEVLEVLQCQEGSFSIRL